jgi:hypothetical protein
MSVTSWSKNRSFFMHTNSLVVIPTSSKMHGKTMVVASCLRDDLSTGFLPFFYGG